MHALFETIRWLSSAIAAQVMLGLYWWQLGRIDDVFNQWWIKLLAFVLVTVALRQLTRQDDKVLKRVGELAQELRLIRVAMNEDRERRGLKPIPELSDMKLLESYKALQEGLR